MVFMFPKKQKFRNKIQNIFKRIRPVGAERKHADRRMDMTKLQECWYVLSPTRKETS